MLKCNLVGDQDGTAKEDDLLNGTSQAYGGPLGIQALKIMR